MAEESRRHDPRLKKREVWIAGATVLLLLAFLIFQQLGVRGWLFPVRVVEGSMAPTLLGDHLQLHCPECATAFQADLSVPPDQTFLCPLCHARFVALENSLRPQRGNRVLINRWNAWTNRIQRWDLVAAQDPREASRFLVKRVVALPGEKVAIENGNVVVDRRVVSKSLQQLREVAIHVDDEPYPSETAESSWSALDETTNAWSYRTNAWTCELNRSAAATWQWLHFCSDQIPDEPTKILDHYVYNQNVSRRLEVVNELLVTCELQTDLQAELCLAFGPATPTYRLVLSPSRNQFWIEHDGTRWKEQPLPSEPVRRVEFAMCDGRWLASINGGPGLNLAVATELPRTTPVPFVGVRDGSVSLKRLSVDRDIFYLRPISPQTVRILASDEYFLLGDNSPISVDSRDPAFGSIRREHLLGTVTRWNYDHLVTELP